MVWGEAEFRGAVMWRLWTAVLFDAVRDIGGAEGMDRLGEILMVWRFGGALPFGFTGVPGALPSVLIPVSFPRIESLEGTRDPSLP